MLYWDEICRGECIFRVASPWIVQSQRMVASLQIWFSMNHTSCIHTMCRPLSHWSWDSLRLDLNNRIWQNWHYTSYGLRFIGLAASIFLFLETLSLHIRNLALLLERPHWEAKWRGRGDHLKRKRGPAVLASQPSLHLTTTAKENPRDTRRRTALLSPVNLPKYEK